MAPDVVSRFLIVLCGGVFLGGAGWAQARVQVSDPDVLGRHHGMETLHQSAAVIARMVAGTRGFDPQIAAAAANGLADAAAEIPAQFEKRADDPLSEACADIWQNWDDFVGKASGLKQAAAAIDPSSPGRLRAGWQDVARRCAACHDKYRED